MQLYTKSISRFSRASPIVYLSPLFLQREIRCCVHTSLVKAPGSSSGGGAHHKKTNVLYHYRLGLRLSFNCLAHTCIQQSNFHFDSAKGLISSDPIFSILLPIPNRERDLSLKFVEFFHPTVQLTQLHVPASSCQDVFGVILTIFWGWFVWGWIRLERFQDCA